MKNQNILPNTLVPRKIRLEVYKEALEIMTKRTEECSKEYDRLSTGLCLILPCLLWGLNSFLDNYISKDGEEINWNFMDTPNMFPELTKEVIDSIDGYGKEADFQRKYVLNSFIEKTRKKTYSIKN